MKYKEGQTIAPFNIEVDKYQPYYYAGASGDYNAIHIDDEYAKRAGLHGIILQGLCTMAYVYRAVAGNEDPGKLEKIKVRFRAVVRPLDKLTIQGKVTQTGNDQIVVELIAENQNKEQVITNAQAVMKL